MAERIPYNAHTWERILRDGDVIRALDLGWGGSFRLHRLVETGEGGWHVSLYKSSGALGLDLTAEQGVATVRSIRRDSAAAASGEVRPGDIVRSVDNQVYFTCETVVEALRSHSRGAVKLGVVRLSNSETVAAAPSSSWSETGSVHIRAGAHHCVRVEAKAPAVLQYDFICAARDIGFNVRFSGEIGGMDAPGEGASCGRGVLLDVRACRQNGRVSLPNAGQYTVVLDNSFSMLRAKHVSFSLGLVGMTEYSTAEQRDLCIRLEAELDERRRRGADIARVLEQAEPQLAKLQAQVSEMEMNVKKAKAKQRENEKQVRESQAKLGAAQERLREHTEAANRGAGRSQPLLTSV